MMDRTQLLEASEEVYAAWFKLRQLFKEADTDQSGSLDRQAHSYHLE